MVEDVSTSTSSELLAALLPEFVQSEADAEAILDAAASLGVDPIDYCLNRCGLGPDKFMARVASWMGLYFSPVVPTLGALPIITDDDPEIISLMRSTHALVRGQDIMFLAPLFHEVLDLRRRLAAYPELKRKVAIAPIAAIRAALARSNSQGLIHYAQHGLAERWPGANALEGPSAVARGIFVAVALLLLVLAFGAAYFPLLFLPVMAIIIVVPAGFRLGALMSTKATRDEPPPVLTDAHLPVYSVLIPLRDEAHMVPLLYRAMSALSYPALCSKSTKG